MNQCHPPKYAPAYEFFGLYAILLTTDADIDAKVVKPFCWIRVKLVARVGSYT